MAIVSELASSDIPELSSFVLEAWRLAGPNGFGWTGATDENIGEIASEAFLEGLIGNPNLKVFVGKMSEKIVGFCALRKISNDVVELAGIIVRQDEVGRGVGTDLFEAARKEGVRSGFRAMLVKTESANARALSFYRGKGFVEEGKAVEEVGGTRVSLSVLRLILRAT